MFRTVFRPLRSTSLSVLFIVVCLAGIFGCDSNNGVEQSKLRVINLSPDAGPVDLFDDGGPLFENVTYATASPYARLDSERHEIELTQSGSFTTFLDENKSFSADDEYTIFLFDFAGDAEAKFNVDNNNRPSSGRTKLRFVHGAPSLRDVDVYITLPGERVEDTTPTFTDERFREISDYVESTGGDYRIRVTNSETFEVIADSGVFHTEGGQIFTVTLVDMEGGGEPYSIAIFTDAG